MKSIRAADNAALVLVPSFVVGKTEIHRHVIDAGGEGTVWKKADQPYEPGRRVGHWIKRKRGIEIEAFVMGFKPGTNGHANVVGALEFGVRNVQGESISVAWVSNYTDAEREAMTHREADGTIRLKPSFLGKTARIMGQDVSTKSKRLRHARIISWGQSQ